MKKSLLTILCTLMSLMSWAQNRADGTAEPYAVLNADSTVLTFYYDDQKENRNGMSVGPFSNYDNVSWYANGRTITKVVFDESFANCTSLTSTAYWFRGMSALTTIEGIINLKTDNVTSMGSMFRGCSGLTSLDLSGFNTARVTDMSNMFTSCNRLKSLDLRRFNTDNVTNMSEMFTRCERLTSLDLSSFKTDNVTNMSGMFQECTGLTSLDLSGFNTDNVTTMSYMFLYCSSLKSLDLSGFNTDNVTTMSYMFFSCSSLTRIYASIDWTTTAVTSGDHVFSGCTSLVGGAGTVYNAEHVDHTYAHIDGGTSNPGYFTDKNAPPVVDEDLKDDVYTVGETDFSTEFYTQFSKYYQIPQGGKWVSKFKLNLNPNDNRIYKNFVLLITNDEDRGAGQYKEYGAFRYDAVADSTRTNSQWGTSYVFPFQYTTSTLYLEPDENEMDPNVQKLGGLVTLTVDRSQADAFVITMSNEQGVVKTYHQPYVLPNFNNDSTNSNIRCYITVENSQIEFKGSNIEPIGGYTAPVATVEPYAVLKGDTLLTFYYDDQKSVRGGIAFLDGTDVNWPSSITSVTQAFFDSSFANFSPTSTANWFNGFTSLTTITGLEYLNTVNVTSMYRMFRSCRSLTSLNVSGFNTANVTNMNGMFYGCSGLTSLDVSHFKTDNVTSMWSMFSGCSGLTSLDVSGFNTVNVTDMWSMFYGCSGLTSLDVSGFNTANVTDMSEMFRGCFRLTSIYAGSEWSTEKVTDGSQMFERCTNLVGGAGTTYNANHVDVSYAHIDGGENNPGYFTEKNASYNESYGVLSDNNTVLTLYYDGNKSAFPDAIGLDEMMQNQEWMQNRGNILTVNFDSSFANCQPTSTSYWFAFCNSLTAINGMEYLNTEMVTEMDYMFANCSALASIDLSHFRAKSLTTMTAMFNGCSLLTSLDLSGFFTFTVTNMNRLFAGCTNLKTIYVNKYDWSTESVTAGDGVFENCTSLVGGAGTTFNDSHIDYTYARIDGGPNSTTPGYFTDKDATSKVATPTFSWNEHTLTVSSATEGATIVYNNLKENPVMVEGEGILLYHTYTYTDPLTIIENAKLLFWAQKDGMANSDSITLNYPYTAWVALTDTLTKAKGIYDLALNNANVPDQMKSELASAISVGDSIYQVRNSSVDEIQSVTNRISVIANEVASLISAEDEPYAVLSENNTILTFYYDKQKTARHGVDMLGWQSTSETITTVNFDTSFAGYRPTSTQGWFAACYALTTINGMENLVTDDVTTMDGMFEVCRSLTNLNLTTFNTANVTSMYMMFRNCSSLTTVDLSSFNTAKVANMSCMFMDNSVLTTIYIGSGWSTAAVTSGDYVFSGCTNLMGGAGTSYDANHVDYTYARIDGGPNSTTPGYFTDKNAPITVAAPEFRFEGDNLTMTTETQNAGIFYKVADLPSMDDAVVESVVNSLIVTADGQSTYYDQPFELKKAAVVKAIAIIRNETATFVSDTTTMVYDYEAWVNLKAAVESGTDLYGRAQGNPNVDTQLLEQLQWALNEGDMIYNQRAQMDSFEAKHFTQRINELCAQIEAQMTPTEKVETPYFRMESDYNNEVAIKTDTDEAEIYYTQNSRMIQGNDTDFGNGTWNLNWKVSGSNASYQVTSGGYNNSYCLKLTSATASTFGSAQAGYKFVNALTKDTYYTLRFKARSESGRGQLQVFCQNDTIDNTRSTVDTLAIGSELADYEVTFKIKNENTNQIVLNFGAVADTYYIDNVLFGAVVSDTTNQKRTRYEQPINLREGATIKAVATKQGMLDSSPAVLDYFYDGWMNLRAVYEMAGAITNECYGDPNVPLQMVQDVEVRVAERYYRLWDRRGREHVDDTELLETYDELRYILDDLYRMKSGFTVDGVSYHAVDSTQVEVIPSLESYYRGAITVPATVNYNNINFRVTTVAQNAFRSEYLTAIFWYAGFALTATDLQSSQNPNLLLYVTEASMAPTDRDNVVINGFAKNIRLSEGGDFYCPQAFTAEAISYTREFKQQTQIGVSRGWETIALPFTVQTITHEQRGVIAPFGNTVSNTHFWLRRLTSNGLQAVPTIEANTAYLISMPNSEEYVAEYNLPGRVTFSAENATVPMTEIVKDESADYVMTPCFTNAAAKQGIYVLNVGEQRSGYPEGSIFESNYRALLPFQAYVEHKGSNPAPPFFVVGDLGGDTTGIDATLVNSERVNSEAWYTLDGRKLQGKPTQKGVYITNGKKVIIK